MPRNRSRLSVFKVRRQCGRSRVSNWKPRGRENKDRRAEVQATCGLIDSDED